MNSIYKIRTAENNTQIVGFKFLTIKIQNQLNRS